MKIYKIGIPRIKSSLLKMARIGKFNRAMPNKKRVANF
jgi:hypothetical protein